METKNSSKKGYFMMAVLWLAYVTFAMNWVAGSSLTPQITETWRTGQPCHIPVSELFNYNSTGICEHPGSDCADEIRSKESGRYSHWAVNDGTCRDLSSKLLGLYCSKNGDGRRRLDGYCLYEPCSCSLCHKFKGKAAD